MNIELFVTVHSQMVDRCQPAAGTADVFIGDRGYCSYNDMVHVIKKGRYFLFRAKDVHSKGILHKFAFPEDESFDINITVTLKRSHSRKIGSVIGYERFIDENSTFDYIEYCSSRVFCGYFLKKFIMFLNGC